ncbi:MFS transporter [Ruminococcus flavefaciens]|uniref:MFS transporter n=1 Tax=Ruminococcus flavefaciens TaxID=1265 RepID=UPI0002E81DF7|nr:MFS transporter [Ruminococcus flavefaciens]
MFKNIKECRSWLLLWSTQSLSTLGSSMTSCALVLWMYLGSGSALKTAMLSVCSYAPYVLMSIFAGALSDKWNKKATMLVCDLFAAATTFAAFLLIKADALMPWHLYVINALNGLMNTVQQPAGEVAATQLIPKRFYQQTSGLRSFSQALNSIIAPVLAASLFAFGGMGVVIAVDLVTFSAAFITLMFFIPIPEPPKKGGREASLMESVREGMGWLKHNPLILKLIIFLAGINLVASAYNAALPAMVLSKTGNNETALGIVNGCVGAASLIGSIIASALPAPKSRVKAICMALFFSMSTENFILAFGSSVPWWCAGAVCGWIFIPLMGANLDVILRSTIPAEMQGRVYACRNTMQFFTIPVGFLAGGALVDSVFEPFMAGRNDGSALTVLFGSGKGSGAAMFFAVLGVAGVAVCTVFTLILRREKE